MKNPQFRGYCWTKVFLTVEMSAASQQSSFFFISYKLKIIFSHPSQKSIGFWINTPTGFKSQLCFLWAQQIPEDSLTRLSTQFSVLTMESDSPGTKESRAGKALGSYEPALQWQLTFITWCNRPHPWHYENVVANQWKCGHLWVF